jgi:predicted lipoprotein with Yx(FWY)xxD motif
MVTRKVILMSRYMKLGAIAAGAVLALSACGGSSSNGGSNHSATQTKPKVSNSPRPASHGAALHVANTSLGKVLVDGQGMTVYLLTSDKPNKSLCSAQCLSYWPPVAAPKAGTKMAGVTGKVESSKATDGSTIATVGGWPLYTYVGDKAPGDVSGEGIANFGGVWYAVSPSGHAVKDSTPSSPSTGGNGY